MNNNVYPQEQHIEVMRALFPVYDNGELQMFKNGTTTIADNIFQGSLFDSDTKAGKDSGTDVEDDG